MLQETAVYTQIHTTSRFISREHVCTRIYTYTYIHICTARFESGLFQEAIGVCSHIPTANFFFPGSRVYGQPGSFQVCSRKQDVCTQLGSSQVCYMKHDMLGFKWLDMNNHVVVVLLLLLLPPEPRFGSSSVGSEGHTPLSAATTTLGQHQYMLSQNYTLKLSTVHALD